MSDPLDLLDRAEIVGVAVPLHRPQRRLRDPRKRLLSKVRVVASGCWEWTGYVTKRGYGKFTVGKTGTIYAHRWAYRLFVGDIPDDLPLDHLCRNTICVNPAHLEPVTPQVNTARGKAGQALGARNRSKSHCAHGHPYSQANTYIYPDGDRSCRECNRQAQKAYQQRRRLYAAHD